MSETPAEFATRLNINLIYHPSLFPTIPLATPSDHLRETLAYNIPLAKVINTPKAWSELVTCNILLELRKQCGDKVSFFSGANLPPPYKGSLWGLSEFIIGKGAEQYYLSMPLITVSSGDITSINKSLTQCMQGMIAANLYNTAENTPLPAVYGAIVTDNSWKFAVYTGNTLAIDMQPYRNKDLPNILGILKEMVNGKPPKF